jgi:hypothetical protein
MSRRVRHLNPAQCGAQIALDARFITGVANGAALSAWASRPVAAIGASQGTGTSQPTYLSSSINGRPAVQFDGTSDFMNCDAGALAITNNVASASITCVAVNDATSADAVQYVVHLSVGGGSNPRATLLGQFSGAANIRSQGARLDAAGPSQSNPAGSPASPCVMNARHDYANNAQSAGLNGVFTVSATYASGAGNTSATNSAQARIGGGSGASNRLGGRIAAIVVASPMFSNPVAKRIRESLGFSFRIATH